VTTVPIAGTIVRRVKRERPDIILAWRDADGALLDLSGYTFTFSVATAANAPALITKTLGISYEVATDHNVRITFTAHELDALAAGVPYNCQLDAVSSGVDRGFQDFVLLLTPAHS